MGIVKQEGLIGRQCRYKVIHADYGDPGETKPLTRRNFDEGGIVTCGQCNERIL